MRTSFRIIKALAIALAVMITLAIAGAVVTALEALGAFGSHSNSSEVVEADDYVQIHELDINVKATGLRFEEVAENEQVRVETTSKHIDQWQDGDTLHITERSRGIFGWNALGVTTIYLPRNSHFERVNLEVGSGVMTVSAPLNAEWATLDFGAGRATLNELYISHQAKIVAGAGLLEIQSGKVNNLELELGAGKAVVNLRLTGKSHLETGAGKLELGLLGGADNYTLAFKKGIGSVTLDGASITDGETAGKGVDQVEVESGVGAVEVTFRASEDND